MTAREMKFLQNVVMAAQSGQRKYGVPTSITIAQAILESGWGESALAVKANNFFGIKARPTDDYVEFSTVEWVSGRRKDVMARFARYASPIDSFIAHAELLATLPRYAQAMEYAKEAWRQGSPEMFACALENAGYSTSVDPHTKRPDYARKLMALIDEFDLQQYDIQPDSGPAKEVAA